MSGDRGVWGWRWDGGGMEVRVGWRWDRGGMEVGWVRWDGGEGGWKWNGGGMGGGKGVCMWICWDGGEGIYMWIYMWGWRRWRCEQVEVGEWRCEQVEVWGVEV